MRLSHLTGPNLEPLPGYTYEPRVLWGRMLRERVTNQQGVVVSETFTPFDREHFYNSQRWPIVLTHMNLLSKPLEGATPFGILDDFSSPEIAMPKVRISKMGSAPFSVMDQIGAIGWEGTTNSGPRARDAHSLTLASFLDGFNTVRWDLELPLTIPDRGMVQFDISGIPPIFEFGPDPQDTLTVVARSTFQFFENATAPQQTPGNTRSFVTDRILTMSERDCKHFTSPTATQVLSDIANAEAGLNPFALGTSTTWDNGYGMPGRQFIARQASVNRPSSISSMTATFAKLLNVGEITDPRRLYFMPGQDGSTPRAFTARQNLTQSIYTRARVQQGGTNTWWWREGAPLALVMPTITPCPVYRFPKPITLGLGEGLTVTGEIPTDGLYPATSFESGDDEFTYESHALYVSVCGYACIPGHRG